MNGHALTEVEKAYLSKKPADLFQIYKDSYDNLRVLSEPSVTNMARKYESELEKLRDQLIHSQQDNIRILEQQEQMLKKHREEIEELRLRMSLF